MALYAIGDLHLSLGSDKPMEIFGDGWKDYVARIREGFSVLTEDDVTVLCGDLSWGMSLEESLEVELLALDEQRTKAVNNYCHHNAHESGHKERSPLGDSGTCQPRYNTDPIYSFKRFPQIRAPSSHNPVVGDSNAGNSGNQCRYDI